MARLFEHHGHHAQKADMLVEIDCQGMIAQTDRAFLFRSGTLKSWFPKSVVSVEERPDGSFIVGYPDWFDPRWKDCTEDDYD